MIAPLRVTFVVPFLYLTGGIRLVLQLSNRMHAAGHDVRVVYPTWPYAFAYSRRQRVGELLARARGRHAVTWMPVSAPIQRVPLVQSAFLPPADVVVATSWPTTYDVARLAPSRGRKVHLVMHHEGGTGPAGRVRGIYGLPLAPLAISRLIADELDASFGYRVRGVVPAGIDPETFHLEPVARELRTVLMLFHPDPRKGCADGLHALDRVRAVMPDVRVRMCGVLPPDGLPDWVEYVRNPPDDELRKLYARASVLLYPSRYEGFGLPPLEAMACGCPVVSTRVGAVPEFAEDGRDALLVRPGAIDEMARAIQRILSEPLLAAQLAENAPKTARRWTIEVAASTFAERLREILRE